MPELVHYSIPAFIILMLAEFFVTGYQRAQKYALKDTAASLSMGIGNVLVTIPVKIALFALYMLLYEYRLFDGLNEHAWVWLLLIPAEDLCYYLFHRSHHEVRILWAAHVNHHSSERYNLATALRQSWTTPFTGVLFWLPLPLLGFHPVLIFMAKSISLLYQFWIHTETIGRLGPLEWILNTPSHHRVHHGSDPKYLDRNHAGIFIIWDRLFGTFQREEETPRYGLVKNLDTYNPFHIAFHEYAAIWRDVRQPDLSLKQRLLYVFGPPGYAHDGSRQTAAQMRAEAHARATLQAPEKAPSAA